MIHHDGFLRAIAEEPDDDTPRLVYADWLDDNGESARAEFIRLQCQVAALPWDEERDDLEDRAEDLLREHEDSWLGPLACVLRSHQFRRGFLDRASLLPEHFRIHADILFQQGPCCRLHLALADSAHLLEDILFWPELQRVAGLNLQDAPWPVHELLVSPHLNQLRSLEAATSSERRLSRAPRREWLRPLVDHACWHHLHTLSLAHRRVENASFDGLELGTEPGLLEHLDLRGTPLTDAGVQALAACPLFAGLKSLDLSQTGIETAGLRALASRLEQLTDLRLEAVRSASVLMHVLDHSPLTARLESLSLQDCCLQPGEVERLASVAFPCRLRRLNLANGFTSVASMQALAESPLAEHLESLNLRWCAIQRSELSTLLRSQRLQNLRSLSLSNNPLSTGLLDLPLWSGFPRLKSLDLSGCGLNWARLWDMVSHLQGNCLRKLNVACNHLANEGIRLLAQGQGLGRLHELSIGDTGFGTAGLADFLASTALPRLAILRLTHTALDSTAVRHLLRSPLVRRLRLLDLSDCMLDPDDRSELQLNLGRVLQL